MHLYAYKKHEANWQNLRKFYEIVRLKTKNVKNITGIRFILII